MRLRRRRPTVLAALEGAGEGQRVGALRRADLEALGGLLKEVAERRVVLLTGEPGFKSRVAAGLAAVAAASGRRTALVECDLEDGRLAELLCLRREPGLREYLGGEARAAEILQPLVLAGPASAGVADPVVCVVAGSGSNAAPSLDSDGFRHAAAKLRNAYQLVVIDGPPLGGGGDLVSAAAAADSVIACLPAGVDAPRETPVALAGVVQRS